MMRVELPFLVTTQLDKSLSEVAFEFLYCLFFIFLNFHLSKVTVGSWCPEIPQKVLWTFDTSFDTEIVVKIRK